MPTDPELHERSVELHNENVKLTEEADANAREVLRLRERLAEAQRERDELKESKEYADATAVVDRDLKLHDTLLTMLSEEKAKREAAEAALANVREMLRYPNVYKAADILAALSPSPPSAPDCICYREKYNAECPIHGLHNHCLPAQPSAPEKFCGDGPDDECLADHDEPAKGE